MSRFQSEECQALPLTEVTSRYFWITEPKEFHSFDTIRAIIDSDGIVFAEQEEVNDDADQESEDQELAPPLTDEEFRMNTHWYDFNEQEFQAKTCAICHTDFENGNRITVLDCMHQCHHNCIHPWLTERSNNCSYCRFIVN